jgi:hypothetical protein
MLLQRAGFVKRLSDSDEEDGRARRQRGGAGTAGATPSRAAAKPMRGAAVPSMAAALWDEELSDGSEDTGIDGDAFMQQQFAAARAAAMDPGPDAPAGGDSLQQGDSAEDREQGGASPAPQQQQQQQAPASAGKPRPTPEKPPPVLPKFGARPVAVVVKRKAESEPAGTKPGKQQQQAAAGGGNDADKSGGGALLGLAGYGSGSDSDSP